MWTKFLHASVLFAGLFAPLALGLPTERDDGSLVTPHGQRPSANVHLVPDDGEVKLVGDEVQVLNSTGGVVHTSPNDHAEIRVPLSNPNDTETPAPKTGWIAYASWYNTGNSPISYFATTWTVPPAPKTNHGQTIFLFNSIEPATGDAILQPVLQWGPSAAGGGAYWSVASWYLVGSQVYHTTLRRVYTGQSLNGLITLKGCSGGHYSYVSSFTNIGGTTITASGSAELVWATETLESYNVAQGSDYPRGSTVFHGINLRTESGKPSVTWSTVNDWADGVSAWVNRQGATNAQVTIRY